MKKEVRNLSIPNSNLENKMYRNHSSKESLSEVRMSEDEISEIEPGKLLIIRNFSKFLFKHNFNQNYS